jgi:hypothetical protein
LQSSYDIYLDGTLSRFNASSTATNSTVPLFKATGLPSIPHVLSIHNTGTQAVTSANSTSVLNINAITWELRDRYGNATSMSISSNEDDSTAFSWHPFDYWMTETQNFVDGSESTTITTQCVLLLFHSSHTPHQYYPQHYQLIGLLYAV